MRRVGQEEGSTLAFGKVLDSEDTKAGRVWRLPTPISYFIAEANGPREGQESPTVSPGLVKDEWGETSPFCSVWLVLSTDDILHLLVVAHGFPTPSWSWAVLPGTIHHCKLKKSHSYTHYMCGRSVAQG